MDQKYHKNCIAQLHTQVVHYIRALEIIPSLNLEPIQGTHCQY